MVIKAFSIPDNMRENWLIAIRKNTKFSLTGCWEWEGRIHNGYGCIYARGNKSTLWVHRVSYALFIGPIAEGKHVDHICRNPICLNPSHLRAVSPIENYKAVYRRKRRDEREIRNTKQFSLWR